MRTAILLSWRRVMYYWWVPLAQVRNMNLIFFFSPYGISVRTTCLQGLQFWFLYSPLGCKDRKDITCKNTSPCCECTICRCWCNNVNTGKFIARYSSLPVHLGNKAIGYLFICHCMEAAYAMPVWQTWTFTKMSCHIVLDKKLYENVLWNIFSHLGNSSYWSCLLKL